VRSRIHQCDLRKPLIPNLPPVKRSTEVHHG
jgi:hypothetical protein